MAVTSIWPVKSRLDHVIDYACNPEKSTSYSALAAMHQIDGVMEYAANDMKTERRELVTGINCTEQHAAKEFIRTKQANEKMAGRLCYHGYQSFKPGEVDALTAHQIGVELAKRLWGDRFEVVVATHCNTGCYHNHFVINSVSFTDGYKFYNSHADYQQMREMSDALCKEYGLSIIAPSGKGKRFNEIEAEQDGRPTRRSMICEDIERAIHAALTPEQFYEVMEGMGYEFKINGSSGVPLKYPAIRPPGAKGFFRFHKLGQGYSWEEIMDRVYENMHRDEPFPDAEKRKNLPKLYVPYPKATGLRALYLRYCYELHIIVKHPTSTKRVHFALREDITKLDQLDAQSRFLARNQIDSIEQLTEYKLQLQQQIRELDLQRRKLRYASRKVPDVVITETLRSQIAELGNKRKELRKEMVLCSAVEERSTRLTENLAILDAEQQKEIIEQEYGKEESENEQLWRGSGSGRKDVSERR